MGVLGQALTNSPSVFPECSRRGFAQERASSKALLSGIPDHFSEESNEGTSRSSAPHCCQNDGRQTMTPVAGPHCQKSGTLSDLLAPEGKKKQRLFFEQIKRGKWGRMIAEMLQFWSEAFLFCFLSLKTAPNRCCPC